MAEAPAQQVLDLQAKMQAYTPLPRFLTQDEITVFAAAVEAGAVIVPRLLRDFLSGQSVWPIQFEGCSASIWPGDQWARPMVAANRAKRDAFWDRVRSGDLRRLIERTAAAQREAA